MSRRTVRPVYVGDCEGLPSQQGGGNDRRPLSLRNAAPMKPAIDRVWFLIQGGRQSAEIRQIGAGRKAPHRKYVLQRLHYVQSIVDYLSVQERIEKQVTPLFRQLTIPGMKGARRASTPSQWRKEFIARVRDARVRSRMKPIEVAADLGVSLDTYIRWETRSLLPYHLIWPFCQIVGSDPIELLTGTPLDLGKLLSRGGRA